MLFKILKKDLQNKKVISIVLFVFIMLSALTLASSSIIVTQLMNSLDSLFEQAVVPHFVQMHKGDIDQQKIDAFSSSHPLVVDQQTVKMLTIDGADLYLGQRQTSEKNSVIDVSFVRQNERFDHLLSLENMVLTPEPGQIWVPIYYMQKADLQVGDAVYLQTDQGEVEFRVAGFLRDAMMNPSIASSKRFLISDADYSLLETHITEAEYLIEFYLSDMEGLGDFAHDYDAAGLAHKGPAVDYNIFRLMNLLTEGAVSLIIVVISILLTTIAIISLRFTILSGLEEDVKPIGVMKAIGVAYKDIRNIYISKYILLTVLGCLAGYGAALVLSGVLLSNMNLYMGAQDKGLQFYLMPLAAVIIILLVVVISCLLTLRRLRSLSAVSALRSGQTGREHSTNGLLSLYRTRLININLFLGIKDILSCKRVYLLLLAVFIVSAFVMILPVNLFNTMNDESFVTYMGIEKSDVRIDLQQSDNLVERYQEINAYLEGDPAVAHAATLVTSRFPVLDSDGAYKPMNVTSGDLFHFPLTYLEGSSPEDETEIALSYLNADELGKTVGDELLLKVDGQPQTLRVSGIYQDVTNGGKSAKAMLPYDEQTLLWYVINIDLNTGYSAAEKIEAYSALFDQAKITDQRSYVLQTFGDTLRQLRIIKVVTILTAAVLASLITSMFLKMLIARDRSPIAVMKNLGFSSTDITAQYLYKTLIVLIVGVVLGTVLCNTAGEVFVSAIGGSMGAPQVSFMIKPLEAYILYPLLLMAVTGLTTYINCVPVKQNHTTTDMFE